MLQATLKKNDKKAKLYIFTVSFVVLAAVALLSKFKLILFFPEHRTVFHPAQWAQLKN